MRVRTLNLRATKTDVPRSQRLPGFVALLLAVLFSITCVSGCGSEPGDPELTSRTYMELVDWHVSGFWFINSPVAWVRVANYNGVPIKDVTFEYRTYDASNKLLDTGTFTCEGTVAPNSMKNFIELYLGLISLDSQHLSVKLVSVTKG